MSSKKLKIAFFSEDFSRKGKGTALVVQKLVEQFISNFSDKVELTIIRKAGFCDHPIAKKIRNIEIKVYRLPFFSTLISYLIFFVSNKNKEEFDAVIFNRNVYPGFWFLNAKKFVLLQYDAPVNSFYKIKMSLDIKLIDLFLKYFGKYFLKAVIAFSKSAREEIIHYYRMSPDTVFSIYGGAAENFRQFSLSEKLENRDYFQQKYGIIAPYILVVSRLDPQKNIHTLIDAILILKNRYGISHKLIIVGGRHLPEYTKMIDDKIVKNGLNKEVVIAPYIEDADMPAVYNLADLLVFPSLLEGFGLPMIEAMKCGIPVVASDIPVLSEVVSGAAALMDSQDPKQLADKIFEVLNDKNLRDDLIRRGLERSKLFSWERTADDLFKIIRNLE